MPSERIQRRIDAFLDEADAASTAADWRMVLEKARAVLAIDEGNEDAAAYLRMAEANLGGTSARPSTPAIETPPVTEAVRAAEREPESFAGGRYRVVRLLGEGGKKKVYLAHDALLDRDVAFALIRTDGLDETGRERVLREAQAMGRLGAHPHIVSIYDLGQHESQPYVVTELLAGGDVEALLAEGPPPLERALAIASGVARGLENAHAQGILHRDLKPGNVWLTSSGPEGVAKLGDFGLALTLGRSRLTGHGMMVGTYHYMPPEQALGGEATPRSDLYSLGCLLYELVTGRTPFQGDAPTAVISQHLNTRPVAPSWHTPHCPPALEDLILGLLEKDPNARPASASAVVEALAKVDPAEPSRSHADAQANPLERLARGVFVGREDELRRLRDACDLAFQGRGSVVMLVGEPGIGKTRTVQELETYARLRGAIALWGRAHESAGAPPYFPWVQIGRAYAAVADDGVLTSQLRDHAVELQRLFPGVRQRFPDLPEPPALDSEEAQFRLFDAYTSFFRAVSESTPLLLVLDDLHWADRATLQLLAHLARELGRARILVAGTYRDTDLDRQHPLARTLAELNREQLFLRIPLRGLTKDEVGAYIGAVAGLEPPARLVERVHEETEGNPFFLAEVVNLMTQEGALQPERVASVSDVAIPEGVKEALGRRLDRLSPEANELLTLAAVLGREFDHGQLLALGSFAGGGTPPGTHDDETLLRLVEEALAARVLEETGRVGEYRFTHALMQETLLGELSAARRVRLHGQIAEALERLYGDAADAHAPELARHYAESAMLNRQHADKAVRFTAEAAEVAESSLAWEEASSLLQSALSLVPADRPATDLTGARLDARLARAARRAGDAATAAGAFHRAFESFLTSGDALSAAQLAADLANSAKGLTSQWVPTEVNGRALLALSDEECAEHSELVLWLQLNQLGNAFGDGGDEALEAIESAAAALGSDPVANMARYWRGRRLLRRGQWDEVERLCMASVAGLRQAGLRSPAGLALNAAAVAVANARGIDAAMPITTEGVAAGEASGSAVLIDLNAALLASVAALRSDALGLEAALPGSSRQRTFCRGVLARHLARHGAPDAALDVLNEAPVIDISAAYEAVKWGLRADAFLATGDIVRASQMFREWKERAQNVEADTDGRLPPGIYVSAESSLVELAGTDLAAATYLDLCSKYAAFRVDGYFLSPLDPLRGALALKLDHVDEADQHFRTGFEWASRPDVRFEVDAGRCQQGLAEVAERRGDIEAARAHLDAAGALFAKHGAKLYLEQVIAKKQILRA